jgi:hypothetical protein
LRGQEVQCIRGQEWRDEEVVNGMNQAVFRPLFFARHVSTISESMRR